MQQFVSYSSQYCTDKKENVPVKQYIGKDGKQYFECLNKQYCISENNGCSNNYTNGQVYDNQLR